MGEPDGRLGCAAPGGHGAAQRGGEPAEDTAAKARGLAQGERLAGHGRRGERGNQEAHQGQEGAGPRNQGQRAGRERANEHEHHLPQEGRGIRTQHGGNRPGASHPPGRTEGGKPRCDSRRPARGVRGARAAGAGGERRPRRSRRAGGRRGAGDPRRRPRGPSAKTGGHLRDTTDNRSYQPRCRASASACGTVSAPGVICATRAVAPIHTSSGKADTAHAARVAAGAT
jgi:hypothetical protein